jgi:hypothetical protein
MAKLPNGDKPGAKISLRTAIDTLRATLILPATAELRKLPKSKTQHIHLYTIIHPTWVAFIKHDGLPPYTITSYGTLAITSCNKLSAPKRTDIHTFQTPRAIYATPMNIVEIDGHKLLLHQTVSTSINGKLTTSLPNNVANTLTMA